ncbi:MAG: hypothetical protein ACRDT8_11500 [Micromonosporaceae bacterium]
MDANSREPSPDQDTEVVIPNITIDDFQKLAEVFRADGGGITGDKEGIAENAGFGAKFRYDRDSKLLVLDPYRSMPGLGPHRLRRTVEGMIAPPAEPLILESGEQLPQPQPRECGVYTWVIGFIDNKSGGVLTYSDSTNDHGYVNTVVNKINPGETPDSHADGFWVIKSWNGSMDGCFGSISYQFGDGMTTMKLIYGLNVAGSGPSPYAHAGLNGQNAPRYTATCETNAVYSSAKASKYLYVYLTVTRE